MISNNVIKSHPNAMTLFMMANGLLAPIAELEPSSIQHMALLFENQIDEIINQSNVFQLGFFPSGFPKFITKRNEVGTIGFIFLYNQLVERGRNEEETKNLNFAISQSDLMLLAVRELKQFKSNTEHVFYVIKYSNLFGIVDSFQLIDT